MRILFLTDTHIRAYSPASRVDNFQETLFAKLSEVRRLAEAMEVDLVLHGGDLFDVNRVSNQLLGRTAELLRSFPCPVLVVPGNHDLVGYSLSSLPHTSLGVLHKAGVVRLITEPERTGDVLIWPIPAAPDIPAAAYRTGINSGFVVIAAHDNLLPCPVHPDIPHKVIVPGLSDADYVLLGHYHPGFRDIQDGRTVYVNPGSLVRMDAGPGSRDRDIQVVLLDTWCTPVHRRIALTSARPYAEVFIQQEESSAGHMPVFVQTISSSHAAPTVDVFTMLEQEEVEAPVKAVIYAEMERQAGTSRSEEIHIDPAPFFIERLVIKGFQSHVGTELTFHPGLNVITGPSDSGKSAIIRALWWLLYNRPLGMDYITIGTNSAEIRLILSDGREIRRFRTTRSPGGYGIMYTSGDRNAEFTGFGTAVPPAVTEVHRMPMVTLAGEDLSLNIARQFDTPLLLGTSNTVNLALLDTLTRNNQAFAVIRGLRSREDELRRSQGLLVASLERIRELKSIASSIAALLPAVSELAAALARVKDDVQMLDRVRSVYERWANLSAALPNSDLEGAAALLDAAVSMLISEASGLEAEIERYCHFLRQYNRECAALHAAAARLDREPLHKAGERYIEILNSIKVCPVCSSEVEFSGTAKEVARDMASIYEQMDEETAALQDDLPEPRPDDMAEELKRARTDYENTRASTLAMIQLVRQRREELARLRSACLDQFGVEPEYLPERINEMSSRLDSSIRDIRSRLDNLKTVYEEAAARLREKGVM